MEIKEIQELLKYINRTNLTDVELEMKDFKLRVQRRLPENIIYNTVPAQQVVPQAQAPVAAVPQVPAPVAKEEPAKDAAPAKAAAEDSNKNLFEFKAPFIGTFYRAPSPDKPPFVKAGDQVSPGDLLGIIEAMKLFNEIESDVSGTVVKVLVENAQPVEYEQPLFLIELA
ncbi:MAG: acetyl-CoA carboxylase biotin carboxyl carrier protein [Bacteroidota bacterium]